jgi:hypothetical protein
MVNPTEIESVAAEIKSAASVSIEPALGVFSEDVIALVSALAKGKLGENEVVLDCASATSGVHNLDLLSEIKPVRHRIIVSAVGEGGLEPELQGTFGDRGIAYAGGHGGKQFPANILGLTSAERVGCKATYSTGHPFTVITPAGRRHAFTKSQTTGLFTKTSNPGTTRTSLVATVTGNETNLTVSELRRAEKARQLVKTLTSPNFSAAARHLNNGSIINCEVTSKDI